MSSPASQRPPDTQTPQTYPPDQVRAGEPLFAAQCGFCHGRDARGGQSGPDLTRSELVAADVRGDKIMPVVKTGRPDKGMPPFALPDTDLSAIIAFIHDAKTKSASNEGDQADGRGRGSPDGKRRRRQELLQRRRRMREMPLANRRFRRPGDAPAGSPIDAADAVPERRPWPVRRAFWPKVTVTLPSGQIVTGRLTFRDEFSIGLIDDGGWRRSWPTSQVKFSVDDPLEAHAAQLAKYTDADMHNVLAYLQTLR